MLKLFIKLDGDTVEHAFPSILSSKIYVTIGYRTSQNHLISPISGLWISSHLYAVLSFHPTFRGSCHNIRT